MKVLIFSFFQLIFISLAFGAFEIPPLDNPVVDQAGMLSSAEQMSLSESIRDYRRRGGPQIGVLVVSDLGGLTIEEASIKVADKWQLGGGKNDDGVLVLLSKKERAVRIEVGQGLEGSLPDIYAKRIIEDTMIPRFRQGQFGLGLVEGLQAAAQHINKEIPFNSGFQRNYPRERSHGVTMPPFFKLLFFIFMFIMFIKFPFLFIGFGGHRRGGFGGSGWGGGSSGGWSGGGGGFSGGGASGRW